MTLYEELQTAKSEEDVKDIYIKRLKLKDYSKGSVDIRTDKIWFEAKIGNKISTYKMFTQLLFYVAGAMDKKSTLFYEAEIPPFLCVIDSVKAAIMETKVALPLLEDKSAGIKWGRSASDVSPDALEKVSQFIGTHFVTFNIKTDEDEFVRAVRLAIEKGEIIRTQITPNNLKLVFDKWVEMIGREIKDVPTEKYALLFFADIMSDGNISTHENLPAELIHRNNKPAFLLEGKVFDLGNFDGYRRFWAIYDRPPKDEYRNYLLERRDSLIPIDERSFKGAYYTPLKVVEKAYDLLGKTLGMNWQRDYIVWDMCCGVGNLETKHANHRNLFMSTLDKEDVDVMMAAKTCVQAERFQYDYLNDDIADDGSIDYNLTNKLPMSLRKIIAERKKKILVLINPPYGEATNADNTTNAANDKKAERKVGITNENKASIYYSGYAKRELFLQFIGRIQKEIPNAVIAMFSTLKYVNSTNFEDFRKVWNAEFLGGFVVHSKSFDGLKGDFPIGFLVWKTNNFGRKDIPVLESKNSSSMARVPSRPHPSFPTEITCEVLDKDANPIGEKKFYNLPSSEFLSEWIKRPRANNEDAIPLKNAITPTTSTKDVRGKKWSDNALASMMCAGNDFQHQQYTALLSSGYCSAGAFFVNPENLWQAAIVFTIRQIIPDSWQNHNDQFLQPNCELPEEFINDCLIWTLFNGKNLTASADGLEWNGKTWSIVNHFIPFTETEVGAPSRFESDFMVRYMENKTFSAESLAVLEEGKKLWREYFRQTDNYKIRDELKLNRSDVGWYQIRNALKKRSEYGDGIFVDFSAFETTYKALTEKLQPLVYEYGFLR